jgi:hypothetical protein
MNASATLIDQPTQIVPTEEMVLAAFMHMSNALAHASRGSIWNALGGRSTVIHWVTPHILFWMGQPHRHVHSPLNQHTGGYHYAFLVYQVL